MFLFTTRELKSFSSADNIIKLGCFVIFNWGTHCRGNVTSLWYWKPKTVDTRTYCINFLNAPKYQPQEKYTHQNIKLKVISSENSETKMKRTWELFLQVRFKSNMISFSNFWKLIEEFKDKIQSCVWKLHLFNMKFIKKRGWANNKNTVVFFLLNFSTFWLIFHVEILKISVHRFDSFFVAAKSMSTKPIFEVRKQSSRWVLSRVNEVARKQFEI